MLKDPMTLDEALHTERFKSYAGAFAKAGYTDWPSLGANAAAMRVAVAKIVTKEPDAACMARMWQEWHEAAAGKGDGTPSPGKNGNPGKGGPKPVAVPDLPPGMTFSLTARTVQLEDVAFRIPDELANEVDDQTITLASDLTALQWLVIARSLGLLTCIVGDRLIDGASEPLASEAAFDWRVPATADFVKVTDETETTSTVTYSHHTTSLVQQWIAGGSAGLATPFAGGAMKVTRDEMAAKVSATKRLRMTGIWLHRRATLDLDKCTELSPVFLAAVDAALGRTPGERFAALRTVFQTYGTSYPRKLVLGGVAYLSHEEVATGFVDESAVKTTVEAVVNAKKEGSEAKAAGEFVTGVNKKVTGQELYKRTQLRTVGGDTLRGSPKQWSRTVKSPRLWRTVERKEMKPLIDRLDEERQNAVKQLWDVGRSIAWDGLQLPTEQAFPDMEDQPFLLSNVGLDGPLSSRWLRLGSPFMGLPKDWGSLVVGKAAQRVGQAREYRWRLVYTGFTSGDHGAGQPFYYLTVDDRVYDPPSCEISPAGLKARRDARRRLETSLQPRVLGVNTTVKMKDKHTHFVNTFTARVMSWQAGGVTPPASQWWTLVPANPDRKAGDPAEFFVQNLAKEYLATQPEGIAEDVSGAAYVTDKLPGDAMQQLWRWRLVSVRQG